MLLLAAHAHTYECLRSEQTFLCQLVKRQYPKFKAHFSQGKPPIQINFRTYRYMKNFYLKELSRALNKKIWIRSISLT